jgi:hypothetical protein
MSTTIDLGKLRFNWVGTWELATEYEINDLVKHGGDVFVYIYGVKTTGNLTTNTIYWALVQEGMAWQGEYDANVAYLPHQVVHHANNSYICILEEPVAGATEPPNSTYWQLLVTGFKFEGLYNDSTTYQVDDIVYYGANTYICIQNTTGTNNPEDTSYWAIFSHGMRWVGIYDAAVTYRKDDILTYGINAYVAKHDVTGTLPTDASHFDRLTEGLAWENLFDITTPYQKQDIVKYGSNTYVATQDTVGNVPTDTTNWDLFAGGIAARSVWIPNVIYYPDDVVTYSGNTFRCLLVHTSASLFAADRDISVNPLWEKFSSGMEWRGQWVTSTWYRIDDIMESAGGVYRCNTDHTSTDIVSDAGYWDTMAAAGTNPATIINAQGQILYNDGTSALAALNPGQSGYTLVTKGPNNDIVWESLFTLHTMEIAYDTPELIADYSGTMSDISDYISLNYATGELEMEINDGNDYSIDRDTGSLIIEADI